MSLKGRLAALAGIAAASLSLTGLGAAASAQEIILYDLPNYGGQSLTVRGEINNLTRDRFNDRPSSVRVVSGTWEVCQHDNFRGSCTTLNADTPSLGSFDNQMTSLRPLYQGGNRGGGSGRGGRRGDETLTLYSGPNYTGRSVTLDGRETNLTRLGFNDQARSIEYSGRRSWRVCQHANFGGACMEITGDVPVIGGGMDRQISSAEPDQTNRRGNRPQSGVWLYDGADYTGQRIAIDRDITNLSSLGFNDRADSIVFARGEQWEVCEHSNFRGRCEYFDGNFVEDLRQYGMHNMITSMRRIDGPYGGPGGGYPGGGGGGGGFRDIDGGVRGVDAIFFPRPEYRGYGIDRCMNSRGNRCDQETANRICRAAGMNRAEHFDVDRYNRVRTWFLGEDRECRAGRCEAIVNVLCTG